LNVHFPTTISNVFNADMDPGTGSRSGSELSEFVRVSTKTGYIAVPNFASGFLHYPIYQVLHILLFVRPKNIVGFAQIY
jgi:hypothetical protein